MRLIDADAYAAEMRKRTNACCKWHSEQNPESEMYARAEQALVTFVEARLTLENQPTIDAIPVEWLESKRKEALHEGMRPDEVEAVEMVLWMWQKEQEAK